MYPEVFITRKIFKNDDFHLKLFDAAVANYFELNNPIRFNNFCYAIRELIREKLSVEAPDDEIIKTNWYKSAKKEKPTRADRIRYYVAKGLPDKSIPNKISDGLEDVQSEFRKLFDILNKYTHINKKSMSIEFSDGDNWFRKVLNVFNEIIFLIEQLEKDLTEYLYDSIFDDINSELFEKIPNEIDCLSTHSSIDEVNNIQIDIEQIDYEKINIRGAASVSVILLYGSESDRRGEDDPGFISSFPLSFEVVIDINNMTEKEYLFDEIDTSSFYQ